GGRAAARWLAADQKPMTVVPGASEGIGYALACRFAAAGSDLILVARRPQLLNEAAERIRAHYHVEAIHVPTEPAPRPAISSWSPLGPSSPTKRQSPSLPRTRWRPSRSPPTSPSPRRSPPSS